MAEVTPSSPDNRKKSAGKTSTRIDMTPMVDLAFLLVTFFMLTTTFSKPRAMELRMPDPKETTKVPESRTTIIVLDQHDRIYYYPGADDPQVAHTDFSARGIQQVIAQKRRTSEKEPIFIIKATDQSRYRNLVDILDEMSITGAQFYSLVKVTPADLELIGRYKQEKGLGE